MPTVLALDVSLSMSRPVFQQDRSEEPPTVRQLAIKGIHALLNHIHHNCKLEFAALAVYSSMYEILGSFTRDFDQLKSRLASLAEYDKSCVETALLGVKAVVAEEWGSGTACQVIIISDGSLGVGDSSLRQLVAGSRLHLPFLFPCRLDVVLLGERAELERRGAPAAFQRLVELSGGEGAVHTPEPPLSAKSTLALFRRLAETNYAPFSGVLHCGGLSSRVTLCPPPQTYNRTRDFEAVKRTVSPELRICGFLSVADVASPPAFSRHLVLPAPSESGDAPGEPCSEEDENARTACFCVLLHGGLKRENAAALVNVGEDWYGIVYSWADNKKKANLMLSLFEPGTNVLPWLGDFTNLGPAVPGAPSPFPIKVSRKRSYQQTCVTWTRQSGLHSDVQKVLRHARKLPDKTQNFYKELNRLRSAALSFGFYQVLESVAVILERECTLLPGNAHPDCALQLTHAATALRHPEHRQPGKPIQPLSTRFQQGS
ncbi:integrator complex subunit 14-like [Amphibalanus amphitrite]|uniref:integrator complex subunit 14-like n=1 Tax=Amphibalanus amphitrite TaxID=1232801 RepID=UPI001C915EAF|nr:integrator complex subunit 14-like [Amphibalanus amphitrite]XP_043221564.1 integrator complex subunit 14-like [Amphibalanus amphitrite]XP_043221565.1 integrator complex subunit 14-like [Amphibalanus amphitrite]XP_043221566.1 integrator complex subunit 14-like [Amphibalanus amphitrite]XP_043221567.1 integrator complex subunit 14-like [Amphibalanus amphitrite]